MPETLNPLDPGSFLHRNKKQYVVLNPLQTAPETSIVIAEAIETMGPLLRIRILSVGVDL